MYVSLYNICLYWNILENVCTYATPTGLKTVAFFISIKENSTVSAPQPTSGHIGTSGTTMTK